MRSKITAEFRRRCAQLEESFLMASAFLWYCARDPESAGLRLSTATDAHLMRARRFLGITFKSSAM